MSENQPGGQSDNPGGKDGNGKKDSVSYDSFQKLLDEKKSLAQRLETIENERLEQEQDLKKKVDMLSKKLDEEKGRSAKVTKTFSEKHLKNQFNRMAEKLGCMDPDLAFRAMDLQGVDLDENFNFDEKELTSRIEGLAKEKSYLFKKDPSAPRDTVPRNSAPQGKSLAEMSIDELKAELAKKL